jgi:hypothetical protein
MKNLHLRYFFCKNEGKNVQANRPLCALHELKHWVKEVQYIYSNSKRTSSQANHTLKIIVGFKKESWGEFFGALGGALGMMIASQL